jgi:hypothetical protein
LIKASLFSLLVELAAIAIELLNATPFLEELLVPFLLGFTATGSINSCSSSVSVTFSSIFFLPRLEPTFGFICKGSINAESKFKDNINFSNSSILFCKLSSFKFVFELVCSLTSVILTDLKTLRETTAFLSDMNKLR